LDAAELHDRQLLEMARLTGDLVQESRSLNSLANIASSRRNLPEAGRIFQESLALARRINNPDREAITLMNLGDHSYKKKDYVSAAAYGRAALSVFRELGVDSSTLIALGNMAQANLMLGDRQAARDGVTEALVLARKTGAAPSVAWAVSLFGQILIAEGNRERGLALYGLARAHPAMMSHDLAEIDEAVAGLALPPEEVEAGLAAGAMLDFETVVGEIMEGKW
jgi:tetratricopeptide (TPR) repeat protein